MLFFIEFIERFSLLHTIVEGFAPPVWPAILWNRVRSLRHWRLWSRMMGE